MCEAYVNTGANSICEASSAQRGVCVIYVTDLATGSKGYAKKKKCRIFWSMLGISI